MFATDDRATVIVDYKDDATTTAQSAAVNPWQRREVSNRLSNHMMKLLEEKLPHFVQELSETRRLPSEESKIVPLEVIVRNVAARRFQAPGCCRRHGAVPTIRLSYKNDALRPLINRYHAVALGITTF